VGLQVKGKLAGVVTRHKARLVAKGLLQQAGVDYGEVFAPMARIETIRLVVSLAVHFHWSLHQLDVKSAFLNGNLEEEVYVVQPQGFEVKEHINKVYRLRKSLYGFKQAPRAWNQRIDSFMSSIGLESVLLSMVFVRISHKDGKTDKLIIYLYVDDLLITGSSEELISKFKGEMLNEFEMSDLGRLNYFLGIEFTETQSGLVMYQSRYAREVLRKFEMHQSNSANTPAEVVLHLEKEPEEISVNPTKYRKIVRSLRYLCNTRLDLCFSAGLISRYMQNPCQSYLNAAKRVLRYLQGTL